MFRRVLILAALVLGCGVSVSAQGFRIGDAQTVTSSLTSTSPITPLQATVNVCVNPANAVPCTNKASTFTSVTLVTGCSAATQVVLAGTTTCVAQTDSRGNWGAWVAAGNYDITFTLATGQSFGPYTISVGIPSGSTLGAVTFTGLIQCKNFENVQCVDSTLPHGGSDIGDEINKAYAALPANGGEIWIFPSVTNTAYSFTTPIVLGTANKIAKIIAHSAATPTPTQGMTLNYTPTTATTAITLDYDNGSSGGGQNGHTALEGFTLTNNGCLTVGGCGSLATGVAIGNTNGAQSAVFRNLRISGFGTGVSNPNNNSWGQILDNVNFTYNTTAFNYVNAENTVLLGVKFVSNGTGITTAGGELTMLGGSLDSSTTVGVSCTGSAGAQTVYLIGTHMENQNGQSGAGANLTSHFGSGTCNFVILGGVMENDNRSAGGTSDWLFNSSGGTIYVSGTELFSGFSGVLTTGFFNLVSPVRAHLEFTDASPSVANPSCGGSGCTAAYIKRVVLGTNNNPTPLQLGDTTFNTTMGVGDAFFTPSTAVGLHVKTANSLDAIRTEDRTDNEVMDFGPGVCGTTLFTFEDITNAVCALEYQFTTKKWLIPATVTGGLTVAPGLITPMASNTALQMFNTTTTCTTAATISTPCTTAAITLPAAEADTNYRISCTGLPAVTGFPQIQTITKSNTTFTITLNNLTAAAASYTSFDCLVGHN